MIDGMIYDWPIGRRFGFARTETHPAGVFIHFNDMRNGQPREGDRVRMEGVESTPKGYRVTGWVEIRATDDSRF